MTTTQIALLAAANLALSGFWYWRGVQQGKANERGKVTEQLSDGLLQYNPDHPLFQQDKGALAALKRMAEHTPAAVKTKISERA